VSVVCLQKKIGDRVFKTTLKKEGEQFVCETVMLGNDTTKTRLGWNILVANAWWLIKVGAVVEGVKYLWHLVF